MSTAPERIDLSDDDAALLKQASRLMSEALDRPRARRIALVEEKKGKGKAEEVARLDVPPATLRLLAQVLARSGEESEPFTNDRQPCLAGLVAGQVA